MRDHRDDSTFPAPFLRRLYAIPNPFDTEGQWHRWGHADLWEMDRATLLAERQRLRLRLLLDAAADAWLLERAGAIEEALRRVR